VASKAMAETQVPDQNFWKKADAMVHPKALVVWAGWNEQITPLPDMAVSRNSWNLLIIKTGWFWF
jgi:hypothetical protein